MTRIPFTCPDFGPEEEAAAAESIRSGRVAGDGPATRKASEALKRLTGAPHVYLTPSGTHAIELALMALNIGPGDEVICPSFTFVSTANAIIQQKAKPVFADIAVDTVNISPKDVEAKIGQRTRAVIPVHYAGVGADMDALAELTRKQGIALVEDAAQAVGATHRGRALGTIGTAGCFSFHETKNVSCGEGGAVVTADGTLARTIEVMREKGTNRSAFIRGEVDKYTWINRGSSYLLSDILAAVLAVQLDKLTVLQQARRVLWEKYREGLATLAGRGVIRLPVVPDYAMPNYHAFYFLVARPEWRDLCLRSLQADGIQATFHYVPLHSSPYSLRYLGTGRATLPVTDMVAASIVRLPLYAKLSHDACDEVIDRVKKFFAGV